MKFFNFLIIIFISLTSSIKADLNENLINQLEEGGKLIFIRHAYAPGSGDPNNFNLNDCSTQRNLSEEGKKQAKSIGKFFIKNEIEFFKLLEKILNIFYFNLQISALFALPLKTKYFFVRVFKE